MRDGNTPRRCSHLVSKSLRYFLQSYARSTRILQKTVIALKAFRTRLQRHFQKASENCLTRVRKSSRRFVTSCSHPRVCFKCLWKFGEGLSYWAIVIGLVYSIVQGIQSNRRANKDRLSSINQAENINRRADENTELANRPYVSIEKPLWYYHLDNNRSVWLSIEFERRNYGARPAEVVGFRTLRVFTLTIEEELIREKVRHAKTDRGQYFEGDISEERNNRLILQLMAVLERWLRLHPDCLREELSAFLTSLSPQSSELQGKDVFTYENQLLFRFNEVAGDLNEYLRPRRTLLFPAQAHSDESPGRKVTLNLDSAALVLDNNQLLVVLMGLSYQGFIHDKRYSTFFLGYSDRQGSDHVRISKEEGGAFFTEFCSWLLEDRVPR